MAEVGVEGSYGCGCGCWKTSAEGSGNGVDVLAPPMRRFSRKLGKIASLSCCLVSKDCLHLRMLAKRLERRASYGRDISRPRALR